MSTCDHTFYLAGLKLRSGQATAFIKGREFIVVCGDGRPQDGQVHVNELEPGATVRVGGISETIDLTWPGPGRMKRAFNEADTKELFGTAYPEVMRIAAANLPPNGAKESRGYARAVADAYVRTLDLSGSPPNWATPLGRSCQPARPPLPHRCSATRGRSQHAVND